LGTWESPGVLTPFTIGGSTTIMLYAQGFGRDISFDAVVSVGGAELGSGSSNSVNLNNAGTFFSISCDITQTTLQPGASVSLDITFNAGMSRGVDLVLGNPTHLSEMSLSSASIPITGEAHLHEDYLHIQATVGHHWGGGSVDIVTATVDGPIELADEPPSGEEVGEDGMMVYDWGIEDAKEGEYQITINVVDESGNVYVFQISQAVHDDHGGSSLTAGNMAVLGIVLLGVMAVGYIGGITPLHSFFDEKKMRYLLAFSAGIFISVALFHTAPESIEMGGWFVIIAMVAGFASVYVVEHFLIKFIDKKFKKKHPQGHPPHTGHKDGINLHLHDHHSDDHEICHEDDVGPGSDAACTHHLHSTSQAAFAGVAFHNFVEGIVLSMLFLNPYTHGHAISWIVLLAVVLHKAPCTLSVSSLLKMGGYSSKTIKRGVVILLAMTPLGALLTLIIFMGLNEVFIGVALAFSTGIFLEIGILDLLPESMRVKKGRGIAIAAFLAGALLLFVLSLAH